MPPKIPPLNRQRSCPCIFFGGPFANPALRRVGLGHLEAIDSPRGPRRNGCRSADSPDGGGRLQAVSRTGNSIVETVLLILLLALVGAIALIVRGAIGYRKGNHPLCRRCGFDLFGQTEGASVCNECGRSLRNPRAVVIGHRHRRTLSLFCGLGLLCPVLLAGSAAVWAQVKHVDLWTYAPGWVLLHEASSTDTGTRRKALAEASRRLNKNQFSSEQIERMIETFLSLQADRSGPWDPLWGDWIETCQTAGKLSVDQWNRYLSQGMKGSFAFTLRPKIHSGDPLAWALQSDGRRAGNRSALQLDFEGVQIEWITNKGNVLMHEDRTFGWNSFGGGGCIALSSLLEEMAYRPLAIGEGTQRFVLHATASVGPFNNGMVRPIVTENLELFATTEVVPDTQATMEWVDCPDLAQAVRQSLSVQISPGTKQPTPVLRITANKPPIGLSFEVYVSANGIESKSDSFACPAGVVNRQWGMGVPGYSIGGKGVDIILRSSGAPALNSVGPLDAWKGEIVFKNVK